MPVTPAAFRRSDLTPAQHARIRRHLALIPVLGNIDERTIDRRGETRARHRTQFDVIDSMPRFREGGRPSRLMASHLT